MRVYFIRHGLAVPHGAPGVVDDASRDLTREGIKHLEKQVQGLVRLDVTLQRVWTSPLLRARQTAEIVARELMPGHKPAALPALAPGGSFEVVLGHLTAHPKLQGVALVGHEPDLSGMASRLLTGLKHSFLELKKGGVACVEVESFDAPVRGELLWLLTPKQLRTIA